VTLGHKVSKRKGIIVDVSRSESLVGLWGDIANIFSAVHNPPSFPPALSLRTMSKNGK